MTEGEEYTIYINPKSPGEFTYKRFKGIAIIFIFILYGPMFITIGLMALLNAFGIITL